MEHTQENLYALILAGGVGSRLWPKSRQKLPKHLLSLHSKLTMLQETVDRIKDLIPPDHIYMIINNDHVDEVRKQIPSVDPSHVIVEPRGRNTALAMGLGAKIIEKANPDAVVINLAADHVVKDKKMFQKTVLVSYKAASSGDYIVTVGIVPNMPHTGLGYIRVGNEYDKIDRMPVFKVRGFTEKPDKATALAFLATKEYFWNANLYTWHVAAIDKALAQHLPDVHKSIETIAKAWGTKEQKHVMQEVYDKAEDVQIDKGVSEKAKNLLMVPGDFGWSDIGDWAVIHEVNSTKKDETVIVGEHNTYIGIDTKNSLVHTDKRLIATIGIENMIIIDTPDALLICPKDRVQDVKKVVEKLKEEKRLEYL